MSAGLLFIVNVSKDGTRLVAVARELGPQFLDAAQLELQPQELDEVKRDGLAVDVVVEVKDVDLDAQVCAVVQRGSVAQVDHPLQRVATHMHQHGVSTVVRQNDARV